MENCYGKYPKTPAAKCRLCDKRSWCKEAGDLPLLSSTMGRFNENFQDEESREEAEERRGAELRKLRGEKLLYSRNDLLEVIVYMLELDPVTLELLNAKIREPDISLSEIARRRNTSRQAVQQALLRKCRENPELSRLLYNRNR